MTKLSENTFTDKVGLGQLSDNPLCNIRYHFIITVAMVARYCIEGGVRNGAKWINWAYFKKLCITYEMRSTVTIDMEKQVVRASSNVIKMLL